MLTALGACANIESEAYIPVSADRIESSVNVVSYEVIVPRDLKVSEANLYYPIADIVWRGDPPGDRYAQIERIFDDAMAWGLAAFNRGQRVSVSIEVTRFHSLTEKVRYQVGGVNSMKFWLTVSDAATGGPLFGPVKVDADLLAPGGAKAIAADTAGQTQKVRITQHLAGTVQKVLLQAGMGVARDSVLVDVPG